MIDMAFLLITFFIMSLRFGQQGEELIKLPNADQAREVTDERTDLITINVTKDGRYLVNSVERSGSELLRYLQVRKDEAKKVELIIRGDRGTQFQSVQRVMRLGAEAGIADVNLAALQLGDDEDKQ